MHRGTFDPVSCTGGEGRRIMVFSSLFFLCVFLPVVFVLDRLAPSVRARNAILIIGTWSDA